MSLAAAPGSAGDANASLANTSVVTTAAPSAAAADGAEVGAVVHTTVAPKKKSSYSRDSCAWYAGQRCSTLRNCYDCLNIVLEREQCTIDVTGMCVSMATYDQYAKANGTLDDPDFLGYFPAANFTYCSISDEKCQSCKERWRQTYADTGRVPSGETCSGANGCLCVAVCEMPDRAEKILGRACPAPFGLAGPRSKLLITMYLGMGLLAMLLIVIIIFKTWHRTRVENARERARRELRERLRNRPLRTGPPLVLKGWSELREKLLESEREFIEGGGKLSEPGVKQLEDTERGGSGSERGESEIELVPRVV